MPFEKPLASSFSELKEDLKQFFQTRVELLRAEISEKVRAWRGPAILIATAIVLVISSWFALVFALIAALHSWIAGTTFAWWWGGFIVFLFLLLAGGVIAAAAYAGIRSANLKPTRTLRVLKQDQEWVQKQTRTA